MFAAAQPRLRFGSGKAIDYPKVFGWARTLHQTPENWIKGPPMTIQLYGFWRSIATFRVRVALRLKGLPFEEIPIDILSGEQFKPGYDAVNPERVVPTFIHDGHVVIQSLAIIEYLDYIQQEPRILPEGAKERAYACSLALMTIADSHPLVTPRVRNHLAKTFGADAKAVEGWGRHWITEALATYERLLARRAPTPFALGAEPYLYCRSGRERTLCQAGAGRISNCISSR
jgi:maleylacetoacetate isomerase